MLLGIIYGVGLWVGLPYFFIRLNDYFQLPVIKHLPLQMIGAVLIGLGFSFVLYSAGVFKFIGKGTPVPIEPPEKLVVKGLYKYTRNPMYVSHLLIFLGYFFVFGQILLIVSLVLVGLSLNLLILKWEEPQLKKRFGKSYLNYMKEVPRWF